MVRAENRGGIVKPPGTAGGMERAGAASERACRGVRGAKPLGKEWRRRELHPGPKIHPRRNLRCVSASDLSCPAWRRGKTAEHQPRKNLAVIVRDSRRQPAY